MTISRLCPFMNPLQSPVKNASVSEYNANKTTSNKTRESKNPQKLSNQEKEQENKFLKVATQHLQKEEIEAALVASLIKRKVEIYRSG